MTDYKIIVFDEHCLLCNRVVKFIFRNEKKPEFYFTKFNSAYFKTKLRNKYKLTDFNSVILIENGKVFYKSAAAFKIAKSLCYPFKIAAYLKYFPKFISDYLYDLVADNRYSIFGKTNSCSFEPELSERIID